MAKKLFIKTFALLLVLLLLISSFSMLLVSAYDTRNLTSIEVSSMDYYYIQHQGIDLSIAKLTLYYDNGDNYEIQITEDMISGFDCTKTGRQVLTINYEGCQTTYEVCVKPHKFLYEVSRGGITITGYEDAGAFHSFLSGELYIPGTLDGFPVVAIGEGAFAGEHEITSVIIDEGVVEIGENAFLYVDNIKELSLPDSVEKIGKGAFQYCYGLSVVRLPNVKVIEESAFEGYGIGEVYLGNTVEEIGDNVFTSPYNEYHKVYYEGTLGEKNAINIGEGNNFLESSEWKYNYCFETEETHSYDDSFSEVCNNCGKTRQVYTVSFQSNRGICYPSKLPKYYNEPIELSQVSAKRTGYELAGWKSGELAFEKDGLYADDADIELRPVWTKYCADCHGLGATSAEEVACRDCNDGIDERVCTRCGGHVVKNVTGFGTGYMCQSCYGSSFKTVSCETCNGSGKMTELITCETCDGNGVDGHYYYDETEPSTGGEDKPTEPVEATDSEGFDRDILGDVNGDEKVNIKDATMVQKTAAKIIEMSEEEIQRADVNEDSKISIKDATAIQKYCAKYKTEYPIGEYIKYPDEEIPESKASEPATEEVSNSKASEPATEEVSDSKPTDTIVDDENTAIVYCDDKEYAVKVGETFTYELLLSAEEVFEYLQGEILFNSNLHLVDAKLTDPSSTDYYELDAAKCCPELYKVNEYITIGLTNKFDNDAVAFVASDAYGFDFSSEKIAVTLEFEMISAEEPAIICTAIIDMGCLEGVGYFSGGVKVSEGVNVNPVIIA